MRDIFDSALQELRSRISDVEYTTEGISFLLNNVKYCGILKGRNKDLVLGLSPEADQAIALRVLLDGDANKMKWSDSQRAQLLQIYKDKITQLGEEEFFANFDSIREEAHRTVTGSTSTMGDLVVFGTWTCNCTILCINIKDVPTKCPTHNTPLLGPPSWEVNDKGVPLGLVLKPHDNRPYAVNCTDGKGIRQSHLAEGYIISPTGRRIGAMCRACAQVVIDEYQTKLSQTWEFEPQDWQPVTQQARVGVEGIGLHQLVEMGTYIDPVHSSAATLGRLGGRVKSEAKTLAVRENGKKGGRPKKQSTVDINLFD